MSGENLQATLRAAIDHHRNGRVTEAEHLYRKVLSVSPDHPVALHHLGIVAVQCGHADVGLQLIGRSVEIQPNAASLNNLGEALRTLRRLPEAVDCYRRALAMDGRQVDAMANLGLALSTLKQSAEAETMLRQALSLSPKHAGAMVALADLLLAAERIDDALAAWEQIVLQYPNRPFYLRSLGTVWLRAGDPYRAITQFRRAIEIDPKDSETYRSLMAAYDQLNKNDEAIAAAQQAVALAPNSWEAHYDLATSLQKSDKLAEAIEQYDQAIKANPQRAPLYGARASALIKVGRLQEAADSLGKGAQLTPADPRMHSTLSVVRFAQGQYNQAVDAARRAVEIEPNDVEGHASLAFALLAAGRFEDGFKEYEWRWRDAAFTQKPRDFDRPKWDGSDPAGRTILVHSEQGFGDIFQFLRYVPMIRARGARVIVETTYKAANLVRRMAGDFTVVVNGTMLPDFDLHVPMMSLPAIFGTRTGTIPASGPYLAADPALAQHWRSRLGPVEGLLVGLVWAGNLKPDPRRSATLSDMAPLGAVPGVSLISMQTQNNEVDDPPPGLKLKNIGPELRDFADTTASVLANLDLLITIDTGVAHLAGAMGVPTWILLPHAPDWRWSRYKQTSAWYPTVRLFRQPARDDWTSVVQSVATELCLLSERGRPGSGN